MMHASSRDKGKKDISFFLELKGMHIFFSLDLITLNLKSKEKNEIIKEMVGLFVKSDKIKDANIFYKRLLSREQLDSTAIGQNVALPYTFCSTKEDIVVAVAILRKGIDFDSLDGEPVKIIFMSAHNKKTDGNQEEKAQYHLYWLARLSRFLKDSEKRELLIRAKSKEEVFRILKENFKNER